MEARDLATLAASPLFSGVDIKELSRALAALPHRVHDYKSGAVVLLAGCAYDELRVVLAGELAAEMGNEEGRSIVVETFKVPEPIAAAVLFAPDRRLPVTVVARSPARLALLPVASLLALCGRFPPLLESLLSDMGSRVESLADKLRAFQFATLRERLADWMLRRASLATEPGGPLVVRLDSSKERLATLFGVARPSLSRELGELQRRGLLKVEGRRIEILDEAGLRRIRSR